MPFVNTMEKTAAERGYVGMSVYNTKEEVDKVLDELHGAGIRAFKAHHVWKSLGIDSYFLWVMESDLKAYREKQKKQAEEEKPKKEVVQDISDLPDLKKEG